MRFLFLLPFIGLAVASGEAGQVLIEGRVALLPPKSATAALARYQLKTGTVEPPDSPAAVVFLQGSFPVVTNTGVKSVGQKGYQFSPALLPIQKGTSVEFPNLDEDYHHVFSYSKAKEFDIGRYRKSERPSPVFFDKAGVVKVGCEIHDHMRAIILVLDTPHFVKTDKDGKYQLILNSVVDGHYVLKAWLDDRTVREQPIDIQQGVRLEVNFPGK